MGMRMEALMKSALFLALMGALAASQAEAAVLVVAEARGVALKPGDTLDSAKPLILKPDPGAGLCASVTEEPWLTPSPTCRFALNVTVADSGWRVSKSSSA